MISAHTTHRAVLFSLVRHAAWIVLLQGVLIVRIVAQSSATDTRTPSALAPGAPAGSYALSGFDNINLYTGSLNFRLPLLQVGGRGGASYTMMLPIEQKWRVDHTFADQGQHWPNPNWWTGLKPGYGPGVLQGRQMNEGCPEGIGPPIWTMTTLTFTAPDGTEYELRDELTGGNRLQSQCFNSYGVGASRGTVFKSYDGSAATFISDATIRDWTGNVEGGPNVIEPTGYLMLRDGTRYRIEWGKVMWMRDRNGNQLTFEYNSPYGMTRVTDSLGRQITVEYDVNDPQHGLCDRISFPGFGGAARKIWITKTTLGNALRSGYSLQTYANLFPYLTGSTVTQHNPGGTISSVRLPDGKSYQFQYNSHSELARVVLPTGGAFEYDWGEGGGGTICSNGPEIRRQMTERRVYRDGVTLEGKVTYGAGVDSFDANGTLLARSKHYFHAGVCPGDPLLSHSQWNEGKEYQTEEYAADGVTVLRRVNHTWQQTAPSWYWSVWTAEPSNNPKLVTTVTTLEPNSTNLVTKQTAINPQTGALGFDQFNNQTDVWEYDYGTGASSPHPIRHIHTDYLTTNPVNGIDYTTTSVHIRTLPHAQQIYSVNPTTGVEILAAQSEMRYDETALMPWYGAVQSWGDPGTARGNPTTSRKWLDTSSMWLETRSQFDQVGNVSKSWDAKNNQSEVLYSATYQYAYPTQNISPAPDPSGQYGSTTPLITTSTYDFSTGMVTSATDANNETTTFEYNDPLDRPTKVNRPDGGWTSYTYNRNLYGDYINTVMLLAAGGTQSSNYQFFDGLGRPCRSFQYENYDASKPWLTTDTQYDAMGRTWRVSQAYRSTGSDAAVNPSGKWTETAYDALGRIRTVITRPDNAVMTTVYSGNEVTVTDQDGKSRRSMMDASGRLTQVVEAPTSSAYVTTYAYDALGNLRKVDQGGQLRFFMYDSLGRLIRDKNPEQAINPSITGTDPVTNNTQWSSQYSYDATGNIISRTDARGVTVTYAYDNLNRGTTVDYSDTTAVNPDVTRVYDSALNGKGRLRFTYAGGNFSQGNTVEHTAFDEYDALGRPLVMRQYFKTGGVWGAAYEVRRAYNLAGSVTSQTYPSGRAVSYTYDVASRLASFTGNLGDGTQRAYSTGVIYDETGGMKQEQFGTDTPVYNKFFYNNRGQLSEIRVSTYSVTTPGQETNWNRGAFINRYSWQSWSGSGTDNNGTLKMQMIYIPNDDQISGYQMNALAYTYDALNRLDKVEEYADGQFFSWRQDYEYDRWGNRTINAVNTTDGIPEPQFTVDTATNRLGVPGGYAGVMQYDAAGNLTNDTHTGYGTRSYDAENRMTSAQDVYGQTSTYTYDAGGRRTRRRIAGGGEVWQVYGMGGELLAEYSAGAAPSTPQKEYGYRSGELLVQATASVSTGAGLTGQYFDNTNFTNLKVTRTDANVNFDWGLNAPHTAVGSEEFSVRWEGKVEPLYTQTYTFYTVSDDGVRLWVNGQLVIDKWIDQAPTEWSGQIALQAGQRYDIRLEFYDRFWGATAKLSWSSASQAKEIIPQSRLYPTTASNPQVDLQWVVSDQLGTPRMVIAKSGSLAGVKRHDYLPFGEEIGAGIGGRTWQQGYVGDSVRQDVTGKERDNETGLDYFGARYYSSMLGRFTSVDPMFGRIRNPQTLNRYIYTTNNPVNRIDPNGAKDVPAHVKTFVFMNMQLIFKMALNLNVSYGGLFALAAWETQWGTTPAYKNKNNPGGMSVKEVPLSYSTLADGYAAMEATIRKNYSDVIGIHDPRRFLESIQDDNGYKWNDMRKETYLKNVRDRILISFGLDFFDDCVLTPIRNGQDVTFNGVTVSNEQELNNLLNSTQPWDQQMIGRFMSGVYQGWADYVKNIGSEKDKNIKQIRSAFSFVGSDPIAEEEAAYEYRVSRVRR
jgi:RHS repeat-associated protein